jgi:L-asparaginase
MFIQIFTTGGTIDKVYFDQLSEFQVGDPMISEVLEEAHVSFGYAVESILQKDSLDLVEEDRHLLLDRVRNSPHRLMVVTHGTDTMIETAKILAAAKGKVIVLTGSMAPARFRNTDAIFNIGCAVAAVQALPEGVYLAMNGRIFHPERVRKNREKMQFEEVS